MLGARTVPGRMFETLQVFLGIYLLLFGTAFGLINLFRPLRAHHLIETRRGTVKTEAADPVLPYVQDHVLPGERVFVYPYQTLVPFLAGTFNASSYEYLQPGMHTPQQFREALAQLAADRTRVVLYDLDFPGKIYWSWPSTPLSVLANDAETQFIFSRYRPCKVLHWVHGRLIFMVRKDTECPDEVPSSEGGKGNP